MFQTTNQMSVGMTLPTHLGLPPLEASGKKTSQCWGSGTIFSTLLALETDRLRLTNSMATLQQANVAMEHLPFIVDFPIEIFIYGGCPIAMLYFPYKSMDQSLFSDSGDFPLSLKQSVYND